MKDEDLFSSGVSNPNAKDRKNYYVNVEDVEKPEERPILGD